MNYVSERIKGKLRTATKMTRSIQVKREARRRKLRKRKERQLLASKNTEPIHHPADVLAVKKSHKEVAGKKQNEVLIEKKEPKQRQNNMPKTKYMGIDKTGKSLETQLQLIERELILIEKEAFARRSLPISRRRITIERKQVKKKQPVKACKPKETEEEALVMFEDPLNSETKEDPPKNNRPRKKKRKRKLKENLRKLLAKIRQSKKLQSRSFQVQYKNTVFVTN